MVFCYISIVNFHFSGPSVVPPTKGSENDIFANGVKQVVGTDVTASNGTTFIFASPLVAGDVVEYVAYGTFALADHYNKTQTDALLDDVEALALAGL